MNEIEPKGRGMYYRRDGTEITRDDRLLDPASWDNDSRRVGLDEVTFRGETFNVSTVHLVINHQYGDGPPLLFETMIFAKGDWADLFMLRYSTEEQALAGHKYIVDTLRRNELPDPNHPALER